MGERWAWSPLHGHPVRVVEEKPLWDGIQLQVWLPLKGTLARIPAGEVVPISEAPLCTPECISFVAAAARIEESLAHEEVLLAPLESAVIPLPHQIHALSRVLEGDRIRYLLADEVGLGKTIEAGLVLRELKMRGLVRRVLVVAPKGLVPQWMAEMDARFGETFRLVEPGELEGCRRIGGEENPWRLFDQVVCSMDAVKPIDSRRGWSREQVAAYNRQRFEDLVAAGWDLIIVDEAHRLGGSSDAVARYRLGAGLAQAAPYLLLLSATPHQGKTESFHRLVALLDPDAFPGPGSVSRERVAPYVVRTAKRKAVDGAGNPLFRPRETRLLPVEWHGRHAGQAALYEAVSGYAREGYNRALQERKNYVGFLMILLQRLVTSSTRAIRIALEKRQEALGHSTANSPGGLSWDDFEEMDGQQQLEELVALGRGLRDERVEVETMLEAARECERQGPDAKAEALLDLIYQLEREEGDSRLKVLVFTEFVPTQEMLRDFLVERGFTVACLNGSMDLRERMRVQEAFAGETRVLVSTEAGGEGLNLQFCHVVVNYDLPWNPMRLEQRIGRVDRIGQTHTVRAVNLVLRDTVEYRVQEVLEEKLAVILREFGVDKAGDVLDSARSGAEFDELFMEALMDPGSVTERVEDVLRKIREEAEITRSGNALLEEGTLPDREETRRLLEHPLPFWVERMTISWLRAHGGTCEREGRVWRLRWPDGGSVSRVVFSAREAAPGDTVLSLEDPRIRELPGQMMPFVPGLPIPVVHLPALAEALSGIWSLWRIAIRAEKEHASRILPLFLHDDGRILLPTARRIWEELLLSEHLRPSDPIGGGPAVEQIHNRCRDAALEAGRGLYEELVRQHRLRLGREREKMRYAFGIRRQALERIGLDAVRAHRLARLEQEEEAWNREADRREQVEPDLQPLLILGIRGGEA